MGTSVNPVSKRTYGDAMRHAEQLRFARLAEPKQVEDFLEIIPHEWSDLLRPWMDEHPGEPKLYGIFQGDQLMGGGAVFTKSPPPETEKYREECLVRFSQNQAYIGFLWVSTEFRGMGAGQFWLQALMDAALNKEPSTGGERVTTSFWLTIEDPALIHFYEKAGFRVVKELQGDEGPEWLLSSHD